ncbi:MAG: alpha-mannosidase [Chloroflexota bacterium]|nr:alpha-mannosidase [Chloroflexota bacterium]
MSHHERHFTLQKLVRRLAVVQGLVYRKRHPLPPFVLNGQPLLPNSYWGEQYAHFTLRTTFEIPADFGGPLALFLPIGSAGTFSHPEALVLVDGAPHAAVDRHHQEIALLLKDVDGGLHTLELRGWAGAIDGEPGEPGKRLFMRECAIVQIDTQTRALVAWARTALQAVEHLDQNALERANLLQALDDAFSLLDLREPFGDCFYESVPAALALLQARCAAGRPLDADIIAIGHAHIDVAWLWTLAETRQKAVRTFHNVLHLMDQFPDFHFSQSQPQLYEYVRDEDPQLFARIQQRVREGRWEPLGGAWIEPDCNVTGAESLARQFLLGRKYFAEHFGADAESPVCWLPDAFGYTASLPQLIKLAGLDYFFSIKLEQNQYNKLPHDSFWWQGIDGSRVLAHFSTSPDRPWEGNKPDLRNTATYNADLNAFSALGSWVKLHEKSFQRVMLMSYGYGDGGGGPTREMNENAQVLQSFPGLPRVQQGKVLDFFQRLENESGSRLPIWNGELYFELHRGTYTSQSRNKRANRKAEFLLHDAELLATVAAQLDPGYKYPHQALNRAWELVCLNQFHDILPGSSIGSVYEDSLAQYAEVTQIGEQVRSSALDVVSTHFGGDVLLINPTSFEQRTLALWAGRLPDGMRFEGDVFTQEGNGGTLIEAIVAPYGIKSLRLVRGAAPEVASPAFAEERALENQFLRVELNGTGDIMRIYDKAAKRELLPPGALANQWQAFEDRPLEWDAWDIDIFYEEKCYYAEPATSIRVVEQGPLRATVEVKRQILNSHYVQRISLTHDSHQIDFATEIDWREKHVLLKAAFPVDLLSPVASYEIQWGHIERPTHRNTSWDWARFEVPAQKWAALREDDYTVALLNDCKYGYDIRDNVLRLSLLRAPTFPDPNADQGMHRFSYSLRAEASTDLRDIIRAAYALNDPVIAVDGTRQAGQPHAVSLFTIDGGAIIETIKAAEDGHGVIVRLYQSQRQRGEVTLRSSFAIREAWMTNLLEEDQTPLEVDNGVRFYLKPFQIVTLRLVML